ncbi:RimK/LysX family protein [Desulfonatronovibrio hydrogenovorans]|uniref:ATP-dependent zinc protease family protein n=2 Tax=Desulfonatronovibrio hydrogenovorans TaxID=53245 RepID=UPI001FC8F276|nr:RimK/LysX family protein [Desulfonatronovibrio hydrogenovorans]
MNNIRFFNLLLPMILIFLLRPDPAWTEQESHLLIMGWVEKTRLLPDGPFLKAKLDTGARTSSMHARDIEPFEKDGQKMVRFTVDAQCARTGEKQVLQFEKPLKRNVLIRQHQRDPMPRPVVVMDFCLGGTVHSAQFSLTDRSGFNYPVLLGRIFLEDVALVDSGSTGLMSQVCPGP